MLHISSGRSHTNISSAKTNRSPLSRNVDAVVVGGEIHEYSIALNLTKRFIDCEVLEKDYAVRHAPGVNREGARTLGRDIPEILLALRPLKPVTLGELAALETLDADS